MSEHMGHTCYTDRTLYGIPCCVFCEDHEPCPYMKAQGKKKPDLRKKKNANPPRDEA
jgi:hypothetical protein